MFPSIPFLVAGLLLAAVAVAAHAAWQRRRLLAKLRSAWGVVQPARAQPDDRVSEAWQELQTANAVDTGVDERTWNDLDLDRVLATIDHTHTALGRQMLYWRLRSGIAWKDSPDQERLAIRFLREPGTREAVGVRLATAGRTLGYGIWVVTRPELIVVRWWYWTFPFLAIAMLASSVAIPFQPRALLVAVGILVVNMLVRMATAWQIPGLLAPMRQLAPLIGAAEQLVDVEGLTSDGIANDVRRLKPLKRVGRWVSRDPLGAGEIMVAVWEYLNVMFILDANALLFGARRLRQLGAALARVAVWVGDTDVALSVASLRAEPRAWSTPNWSGASPTRVVGIWHPLIVTAVANDVELDSGKGIVVTGANMSGKSTYLRAVGIAAELARAFDTCPATSWNGGSFRVRSLIGRNDDLATGKSYYQIEADGVVGLLRDATQEIPTIFLLDELLRGTNTIERLAAGEAVLRALLARHAEGSPHAVIVATHDGELVSMLSDLYVPFHFRETIEPAGLVFDYRRRLGPASTRTAIALLEATGTPAEVVSAARLRAEQLDANAAKKALLAIMLLLAFVSPAGLLGQSGTARDNRPASLLIVVRDSASKPLIGARIEEITEASYGLSSGVTDSSGRVLRKSLTAGCHGFVVRHRDFVGHIAYRRLQPGEKDTLTITMMTHDTFTVRSTLSDAPRYDPNGCAAARQDLPPRTPEAARAASTLRQLAHLPKLHGLDFLHQQLCDAIAPVNLERVGTEIDHDDLQFAAIVAVDRSRRIGERDAVLEREAGARTQLHFVARRNRDA